MTVLSFPVVLAIPLPLPLPLPLPCCLSELPRGSTLTGMIAEETKDGWTAECNALTLQLLYVLLQQQKCSSASNILPPKRPSPRLLMTPEYNRSQVLVKFLPQTRDSHLHLAYINFSNRIKMELSNQCTHVNQVIKCFRVRKDNQLIRCDFH